MGFRGKGRIVLVEEIRKGFLGGGVLFFWISICRDGGILVGVSGFGVGIVFVGTVEV